MPRNIRLRFNEAKAAQAAARLLFLNGRPMKYMKLLKLMYLVDREALIRWGRPVSTDRYVSMSYGPVLSTTLDRINHGERPGSQKPWHELISRVGDYSVGLKNRKETPPDSELSRAEEDLIREIFEAYGHRDQWGLVDFVHELPEWKDPNGSAIPIQYRDILKAANKTEEEIEQIEGELDGLSAVDRYCQV